MLQKLFFVEYEHFKPTKIGGTKIAQAEKNSIVAVWCVLQALWKYILQTADQKYKNGDGFLVYSETEKEWLGPFDVIHVESKTITIQDKSKKIRKPFNDFQIKPFFREYEACLHILKMTRTTRVQTSTVSSQKSF